MTLTALTPLFQITADIAVAIEETITTPAPGFGHGLAGDIAAAATFLLTTLHIF